MRQDIYPRIFVTPAGRAVSPAKMHAALKVARANPDKDFAGWEWYHVSGRDIVRGFQRGLDDRINRRAA